MPVFGPALQALERFGAEDLRPLFEGADLRPCLLHGDLWRGNFRSLRRCGTPVLLDPAASWGHSECDVAQVELLEAPEDARAFFKGYYSQALPQAPGFELRASLYALCVALRLWATFPRSRAGSHGGSHAARCEDLASAALVGLTSRAASSCERSLGGSSPTLGSRR